MFACLALRASVCVSVVSNSPGFYYYYFMLYIGRPPAPHHLFCPLRPVDRSVIEWLPDRIGAD